ncbi:unnamed protein product [Polarella glacialis]|uniref:Acyltransferase 3 domain-containing protein n=1 Tax=Polarella glacialis TaxID=89957 RepID=A0A813GZ14_POLGL|nr:unnamed protein product [Polarella glacialis]
MANIEPNLGDETPDESRDASPLLPGAHVGKGRSDPKTTFATGKESADEGLLHHLMGFRSLLSLWILADHFIHRASVFTDRANVAVDCFIIMSGFVTQWAYGARALSSRGQVAQFLARRVGRVLLTTYVAMLVATLVMAVQARPPGAEHMARCMLFVESWLHPQNWCPNGQTWTIAALLPSWLLYPLSKQLLATLEAKRGSSGLLLLLLGLWTASLLPSLLVFALQGGWMSVRQHNFSYVWPPSQLADFAIGMVAAALARRHGAEGARLRGLLADTSLALVFAAVLFVPSSGYHEGWEPLFNHALAPALAAFFYGSSAAGGSGLAAAALGVGPLARVGKYSFEVFLFQQPLFSIFEVMWIGGLNEVMPKWSLAVMFLFTLYTLSALYAEFVEAPIVHRLRVATAGWGE